MTLGELRKELLKDKIRQVGILRKLPTDNGKEYVAVYFSNDESVLVPFKLKKIYTLVVKTGADSDKVNSEKVKALKRAFDL